MTSEQPDKYAYYENENNQNVFLPDSESFWIKFDLCVKFSFHAKKTIAKENENNQNVVFLPDSESFWIKFDLCLKISFHAKKNSEFLKIALSGKAKFKHQKFENFG